VWAVVVSRAAPVNVYHTSASGMCHLETHHDEAERPLNFLPYFLRSFAVFLKKKPGLFFQSPQTDAVWAVVVSRAAPVNVYAVPHVCIRHVSLGDTS